MLLDRSLGTTSPAEFGIWHVPIGTFWAIVIGLGDGNPPGSPSDILMSNLSMKTHAKATVTCQYAWLSLDILDRQPWSSNSGRSLQDSCLNRWVNPINISVGLLTLAQAPDRRLHCGCPNTLHSLQQQVKHWKFLFDGCNLTVTYLNICIMKKNKGSLCLFLLMKDFKFKISCSLVSGGARKLSGSDLKANACESTWHLSKRHVNVLQAFFFRLFPAYTLLRSWQSIPSSKKWQHQLLSKRNRWMILDSWIIPTYNLTRFNTLTNPATLSPQTAQLAAWPAT